MNRPLSTVWLFTGGDLTAALLAYGEELARKGAPPEVFQENYGAVVHFLTSSESAERLTIRPTAVPEAQVDIVKRSEGDHGA